MTSCATNGRAEFDPVAGCSAEGCNRPHNARGFCKMHYRKFLADGSLPKLPSLTLAQKFWAKVKLPNGSDGCLEWISTLDRNGYGSFRGWGRAGIHAPAHRFAYEQCVGPIPEGLVLDHLCRNRKCVRPDHLDPVTHRVNILRGVGASAMCAGKTHCKHGHEFTEENTYLRPDGRGRHCRECIANRNRPSRAAATNARD